MQMFIASQWTGADETIDVVNPFDGSIVDTVPRGTLADVDRALSGLVAGAEIMRGLAAYDRAGILRRAAALVRQRQDNLAETISREEGKIIAEARAEAGRAIEVLELSAEEARRLTGETLPLDAAPGGAGRLGFTIRVPCGVVAAITPFNFPLNLVAHKVGPALAGGNAVIIKPASDTPLSALALVEILLEAGLPPEAIACVTGPGGKLGDAICGDPRVRKISFTGSREIGEHITRAAGIKRVTLELGSNSPVVILDDADLELAARAVAVNGYANAGQVCISAQRIIAGAKVYGNFIDSLAPLVANISTGNPLDPAIQMGPMIRESDAARVESWIGEAVAGGARVVQGGSRDGGLFQPTIVADVRPEMRVSCDELFGPAVAVTRAASVEDALRLANDSRYGLSAAIFTRDLNRALRFARDAESGNIHINGGPQWRADLMPYGGLKESGLGKEGPKYAILEMTESKTVIVHGVD
ncbi:MAG: aldehyde dehydrogenase family protein [Pirellulales bacterium]|nr:aldehyde dehydrogenase family protein [Pirellulales bacterium]